MIVFLGELLGRFGRWVKKFRSTVKYFRTKAFDLEGTLGDIFQKLFDIPSRLLVSNECRAV